jgi:hypothetical protein
MYRVYFPDNLLSILAGCLVSTTSFNSFESLSDANVYARKAADRFRSPLVIKDEAGCEWGKVGILYDVSR